MKSHNLNKAGFEGRVMRLLLFSIIISSSFCGKAQKSLIKTKSDQLFFNIPLNTECYSVRKILQKDNNFYNIREWDNGIAADFYANTSIKLLGINRTLRLWFDESSKMSRSRKISFSYTPSQLEEAENQLKLLYDQFNPVSFFSSEYKEYNNAEELNGEGFYFYSSRTMAELGQAYLSIGFRYSDYIDPEYIFEIAFKDNNLE